ncbi:MAG TPA: FGGY-family carbohydrate kinase, partial [Aggregatilineales bacterium]|nr:FGGY-family carbohydrate kinase [Aggregatilineales bacterium]
SGTWSLIGLEVPAPIINDAAFAAAITNEGGAYGTFRLLQNVMGLWLAQESRATWAASGKTYSYDELVVLAEKAPPFRSLVDPNDSRFLDPGDMPQRIRDFCRETGQPIPETEGAIMRTIFESLALKYRAVLDKLVALTGSTVDVLHIIGGGSQNRLLNQMTANAINRPVVAGPVEASTLGNAIVQFISLGELADIWQARDLLSHSVGMRRYEPQNAAVYEEQYARFKQIADRS